MHRVRLIVAPVLALVMAVYPGFPANHREAPITSFDHKADITDVYAFRSYDPGATPRVTLILGVDPLQEPGNGPNWWPFDPDILYEIKIDNNNDAVEDIVFQFRFSSEQRLPNLFQAFAGAGTGIPAPSNSPPPVGAGTPIVPPQITSFADVGLGTRQSYRVTLIRSGVTTPITGSGPFYAVPSNVGPRTLNYDALFTAGTYNTNTANVKVFAGTVDDPFWIDLGAAFDTFNVRSAIAPGVLSPAQDAANVNIASDTVSGYSVNVIAIEAPVSMLTRTASVEPPTSTAATIGVWGTTSRPRLTTRRAPLSALTSAGSWSQVQRMGNPLINELLVGTGYKDRFSMDQPKNDAQFASFFLDPALARILNAATAGGLTIPTPPRTDLLPLVTYAPPIAATGTTPGPVADLLRLNTGVTPTPPSSSGFSRLGLLGGDPSGYPNGRRLQDDVVDISLRAVAGVLNPSFNINPNNRLGDGVNVNDRPYRTTFPYVGSAPSGRDRRHIDPGEPGCTAGARPPACPSRMLTNPFQAADKRRSTLMNLFSICVHRRSSAANPFSATYPRIKVFAALAFSLSPGVLLAESLPFDVRKAGIRDHIARRDFGTALQQAAAVNREWPDDIAGYQLLAEAHLGLGNYEEAEKALQWMLDLRIGKADAQGWLMVARFREATGDIDGALEAVRSAWSALKPEEGARRVPLLAYSAHLQLIAGKAEEAAQTIAAAGPPVAWTPEMLITLARVRESQGRRAEAVRVLRDLSDSQTDPRVLYQLARISGAPSDYAAFEQAARNRKALSDNANAELAVYWAGAGKRPADSLDLARSENARRHDAYTVHALAVALHANGKREEARSTMRRAIGTGTRDPEILRHAARMGVTGK